MSRLEQQIRDRFDGLEPVEPGLVAIARWRTAAALKALTRRNSSYRAVARKP
ncbi:SAM-dependent methyltransferase [Nocardia sp. NPDC051321]|uniref:SAM-dependent methyltransferase n=1 Tax=Nocardia sp. NPDC051321 TaxID=3364323 RepID=UPI0037B14BBF